MNNLIIFFPDFNMGDSIYDAVTAVLPRLDEERLQKLVERLVVHVGMEEAEDLQYVKEEDVNDLLTPFQCRKFLDVFQRRGWLNM